MTDERNEQESDQELSGRESLELIARMISTAKRDYRDTGVSGLLWGSVITFCSLVTFLNSYLKWEWLGYIWFLTFAAVIPQVIVSIRESRNRKHKAYEDELMGGIWISFAIAMFLLSWYSSVYQVPQEACLFLVIYGIPTFTTGYARRFRPMIIGGIACWVFAILSTFSSWPYTILYPAAAAQLAWFIPGLILRRRYLKAKRQHV
ncbi:MAG TPA: hypothetical protein VGM30_15515 [Puia sp.]|jgi:hypothetical protein